MRDIESVAGDIYRAIERGDYSIAASMVMRLPDNGRRTLVRLRVERHLDEEQTHLLAKRIKRLESDGDVEQGPQT